MKEIIISSITNLRKESGITQETLADAVGVTRQTIIAIEKGNYSPSLLLAAKISRFFKKQIEDVFSLRNI